ncbi:MAG: acylphosphatase [Propionibacterium sp.]|jgi:acylphosphatase|nr:acylphosphatase [Propionibacterium sp.]
MTQRAVQVVVTGRVQGVGFRWSALDRATALGVAGWVRNLRDGSVEAWVEGPADAVATMVEWLREGPAWASVRHCKVTEQSPLGMSDFFVR